MSTEEPKPVKRLAKLVGVLVALRTSIRAATSPKRMPPPAPESDIDPSERTVPANRRAETVVAILLLLAAVCGFGFTAVYIVRSEDTQLLGLTLGLTLALLAGAAIVA